VVRFAALFFVIHQPAYQPYLTRVVDIVKRDAPQLRQQFLPSRRSPQFRHGLPQSAVLAVEQVFVCAPRRLSVSTGLWPHKKVAAL
jgi:hypothetical protein